MRDLQKKMFLDIHILIFTTVLVTIDATDNNVTSPHFFREESFLENKKVSHLFLRFDKRFSKDT